MGGGGGGYFGDGPSRHPARPAQASSNPSTYGDDDHATSSGAARTTGQGGGGPGGGDPCNIRDAGSLRSPDPAVLGTLGVGMTLGVEVRDIQGVPVLVAVTANGGSAGAIDCPREQDIIDCIGQNHRYAARIDVLQGGAVSVGISRVGTP